MDKKLCSCIRKSGKPGLHHRRTCLLYMNARVQKIELKWGSAPKKKRGQPGRIKQRDIYGSCDPYTGQGEYVRPYLKITIVPNRKRRR